MLPRKVYCISVPPVLAFFKVPPTFIINCLDRFWAVARFWCAFGFPPMISELPPRELDNLHGLCH